MCSQIPLDEAYFTWLAALVVRSTRSKNIAKTHWKLLRKLYTTEFVWHIPNDDNRKCDGLELRREFVSQEHLFVNGDWMDLGCSMLEMLIGLSRRLEGQTGEPPKAWFWRLMGNVGLADADRRPLPDADIDDILETIIWRTYDPSGRGGLFPLKDPHEDQRRVELWYQFCAYILEHDLY